MGTARAAGHSRPRSKIAWGWGSAGSCGSTFGEGDAGVAAAVGLVGMQNTVAKWILSPVPAMYTACLLNIGAITARANLFLFIFAVVSDVCQVVGDRVAVIA